MKIYKIEYSVSKFKIWFRQNPFETETVSFSADEIQAISFYNSNIYRMLIPSSI